MVTLHDGTQHPTEAPDCLHVVHVSLEARFAALATLNQTEGPSAPSQINVASECGACQTSGEK
jgi:hypothetical protein